MRRVPQRRDANEPEIIDAFRKLGWSVEQISKKGVPDLVVSKGARMLWVEVKGPKGKLTPDQIAWRAQWVGTPPVIVRSVHDVLRVHEEQG